MSIFGSLGDEATLFLQRAQAEQRRNDFLRRLAEDPQGAAALARRLSDWGDQAPTISAGALLGLAIGGIGPDHPVGRKVIERGLPAMTPTGIQSIKEMRPAVGGSSGAPGILGDIGGAITDVGGVVGRAGVTANRDVLQPIGRLGMVPGGEHLPGGAGRELSRQQASSGTGGEGLKTAARVGFTGLQAGAEGVAVGFRGSVALEGELQQHVPEQVLSPSSRAVKTDEGYLFPTGGGGVIQTGTLKEAFSPGQITAYQAAVNKKSLGTGILPGGEAHEAAVHDQQQAARINGHALTPGRALASEFFDPDSAWFNLASGTVDATVATKLDPANAVMAELSAARKAAHYFTADGAEAIARTAGFLTDTDDASRIARVREYAGRSGEFPTIRQAVRAHVADNPHLPQSVLDSPNFHATMDDELAALEAMTLNGPERHVVERARALLREAGPEYEAGASSRLGFYPADPTEFVGDAADYARVAESNRLLKRLTTIAERYGEDTDLLGALTAKIKADPGSVRGLADDLGLDDRQLLKAMAAPQAGVFRGLIPYTHRESVLTWMNGNGRDLLKTLRDTSSFSAIRAMPGFDKVPPEIVARLAAADTDEAIRKIYTEVAGMSVVGPTKTLQPALRKLTSLRMFNLIPEGSIDKLNPAQAVEQAERLLRLAKVPKSKWDEVLVPIATAKGPITHEVLHGLDNAVRDRLVGVDDDLVDAIVGTRSQAEIRALLGKTKASDDVIERLSRSTTADTVRKILGDETKLGKVPYDQATYLTRRFRLDDEQASTFFLNEIGEQPRITSWVPESDPIAIDGPTMNVELLGRVIPPLPYRRIRQANTRWRQMTRLYDEGYLTGEGESYGLERAARMGALYEAAASAWLTRAFKTTKLWPPRLGVVIVGEEQARIAAAGFDSMFAGQNSWWGLAFGKRGLLDPESGKPWVEQLGDMQSNLTQAAGRGAGYGPHWFSVEQQFAKGYDRYAVGDPGYVAAWVDRISNQHLNAPSREAARAILDPAHVPAGVERAGIDGVKDWFFEGAGRKYLNELNAAKLKSIPGDLGDRVVADWYIDNLLIPRLMVETAGDNQLLEAVAHGKPFDFNRIHQGIRKSVDKDFMKYLREKAPEIGPEKVVGRKLAEIRQGPRYLKQATDAYFHVMLDVPITKLSRIPLYKQIYWQEIQRMMPRLEPEAQEHFLRIAAESKVPLRAGAEFGEATVETAIETANIRTLALTKDMLDYPSDTMLLEDYLRNAVPFGRAYRDALTAWFKITKENPRVIRRGQQLITEAQSLGVIHKDAEFADQGNPDVVSIFGPTITRAVSGAFGFNLEGRLSGLNVIARGLPGVGLGLQLGADKFVPQGTVHDAIQDIANPYGAPDLSRGVWESMLPGLWDTLQTSGLKWGPFALMPDRSPDQQISFDNFSMSVFATMAASHQYDLTDPVEVDRMLVRARKQAQRLYVLKALGQAFVPTSLRYNAKVKTEDGEIIELFKVGEWYHNKLDELNGDVDAATKAAVQRFGPDLIYGSQDKSRATVTGLPQTLEGQEWKDEHKRFTRMYPALVGYFIPQRGAGQKRDIGSSRDQIRRKERQALTLEQWSQLADERIGNSIYAAQRAQLPDEMPADLVAAALRGVRDSIAKDHPYFNRGIAGLVERVEREQQIKMLTEGRRPALDAPEVRNTPLAKAARSYLAQRQQILDLTDRQDLTGEAMLPLRAALHDVGSTLARDTPEFAFMWDYLLRREVDPDGE